MYDNKISLNVNETWLLPSSPMVDLPNYVLIHKGMEDNVLMHGVCFYVGSSLRYNEIYVNIPNVLVVHLLQLKLHVLSIYHPPFYSEHKNLTLLSFLYDFCTGKELLIQGSLNLPSIKWGNKMACGGITLHDLRFYHCLLTLSLTLLQIR